VRGQDGKSEEEKKEEKKIRKEKTTRPGQGEGRGQRSLPPKNLATV
jgi:hypothetical protein